MKGKKTEMYKVFEAIFTEIDTGNVLKLIKQELVFSSIFIACIFVLCSYFGRFNILCM